jgi:hypothetical protein
MKHCKACFATNPDAATICAGCKAPLDKVDPPASPSYGGAGVRRVTVAETEPVMPQRTDTWDENLDSLHKSDSSQHKPSPRRVTIYVPPSELQRGSADADQVKPPASTARKIVGVLVTYSWADQGQIFPVREGRNLIGSDPQKCDIAIPQDDTLSAVNSHIIFRKNFVVGDDVSMGGTDVDGAPVETAFVPLQNYARIRTGSTHWTFIAIHPVSGDAGDTHAEKQ